MEEGSLKELSVLIECRIGSKCDIYCLQAGHVLMLSGNLFGIKTGLDIPMATV